MHIQRHGLDNTHTAHIVMILEDHLTAVEDCVALKDTHVFYTFLASSYKVLNQHAKAKQYLKKQYGATKSLNDDRLEFVAIFEMAFIVPLVSIKKQIFTRVLVGSF